MRLVQIPSDKQVNKRSKRQIYRLFIAFIIILLSANYLRPLPEAKLSLSLPAVPDTSIPQLAWPKTGQSAIAADSYGLLAAAGENKPIATASIAKVITALCVLEKYPLSVVDQGQQITFKQADVELYQQQVSQNGSRLPVQDGQQMSVFQALQAIMIPSANNIADSLAIWAFGSLSSYATYANDYLARNNLSNTHVGSDASGLDPSTTSTATDLALLGIIARQQPVLMAIASQKSVSLPNAGDMYNYNTALGNNGINGLKTGNNEQNPGALLFTADAVISGKTIQLSGSVLGAANLSEAISMSESLVASVSSNFEPIKYISQGQKVGQAETAWGGKTSLIADKNINILRWKSEKVVEKHSLYNSLATDKGKVGIITAHTGPSQSMSNVEINQPIAKPSVWWRLTRF